jgi:membrane-bound lytic murein transglycosylase B
MMRPGLFLPAMLLALAVGAAGCTPATMTGGGLAASPSGQPESVVSWLQAARDAVTAQQPRQATSALDHAETMLLDAAPPPAPIGVPEDPTVIRQIARAREAIMYRKWNEAQTYITEALQHPVIDR